MAFKQFREIFPDLVFGSFLTITACLKLATGPIEFRTVVTTLLIITFSSSLQSFVKQINANGTSPFNLSFNDTTAQSANSSFSKIAYFCFGKRYCCREHIDVVCHNYIFKHTSSIAPELIR